ncbi:MAG: QueT transporter family protein [Eubacteriales bacterium]|nr:QueT transporter family protein [Eubacteriales bacterium]
MKNTKYLVQAAVIAAIYSALTILLMPLSYGVMQVRIAEALTILPAFTPAAIPGLFVGCLVANMVGPYGVMDMVCGSIATLLAALSSYRLRKKPGLVPLPPIIANGLVIGSMLYYAYGVPLPLPACILWVALGEALACYGLGLPLIKYLNKRRTVFRL